MMRPSDALPCVYLCRGIVDFRKGINGLAVLVETVLQQDPFSAQLFIFCNRNRDKVKILYWERNGFCLWQKRLEKARFKWPRKAEGEVVTLTGQQLNWLLDGLDVMRMEPHETLHYSSVL
ncbi:MAG: IS66 family insertion sequence element accessory protein TnpB [Thiotrichaceae bacterium]|nr:IS66 family insertion sequence element accessory protein TnpB [Thiotrichaceae bacterium]MBL1260636.1 IS66 family insertion sequence element accessory protein TnpB [Thiotrichaceae bacterium]MBL1261309.1 IS66 family insertion sequence element accessory protein TnpB [Thiotrichaceae bacterium]MBL1261318.1 IS66 family insertion sequence element accessory protein TnpB [Thiotrichaceae bacterium]MBL1261340.1 IS66 family insertion sequence element accessory protein TnpB [Thiotrichaceae bacterium]